ncbi:MAG: hypothetical protein FWD66_02655 [Paludibacter sp.]|nr:hypothetical protein [Paludibacter sp.]
MFFSIVPRNDVNSNISPSLRGVAEAIYTLFSGLLRRLQRLAMMKEKSLCPLW